MIPLLVFYGHLVTFTAVFTKRWQDEGVGEGLMAVAFMMLIFFVGWSIASFLTKLVMPEEGFGRWFDRDAASLLLLTLAETLFYVLFFRKDQPAEKTTGAGS